MSFIRPILEYGDIVWDNCNERESTLIEDIQITGLRINSLRSNLYQKLGWDMLCVKRKMHKLMLFYKIVYGLTPSVPSGSLKTLLSTQTSYSPRNHNGLSFVTPQARTASYHKSFFPSTINLWNDLSLHIRSLPTLSSFSNAIKQLFFIETPRNFLIMGIVG